jgi:hypothetical protein
MNAEYADGKNSASLDYSSRREELGYETADFADWAD